MEHETYDQLTLSLSDALQTSKREERKEPGPQPSSVAPGIRVLIPAVQLGCKQTHMAGTTESVQNPEPLMIPTLIARGVLEKYIREAYDCTETQLFHVYLFAHTHTHVCTHIHTSGTHVFLYTHEYMCITLPCRYMCHILYVCNNPLP